MYEINGWLKISEEDVWDDGCQPDTCQSYAGNDRFTGRTAKEVIQKFLDFVGCVDGEAVCLDACEELGRIDVCRTENDEGNELSPSEIEAWKSGELRAWYVIYTGRVERVKRSDVRLQSMRRLTAKYTGE